MLSTVKQLGKLHFRSVFSNKEKTVELNVYS